MEVEVTQLALRYEALRTRSASRERRLLSSLAEIGQQTPVVVVAGADAGPVVLVDGYKRVRALKRLGHDTAMATLWALSEPDALMLERTMRASEMDSALSQGWFLRELYERFGLSLEELARRFDKTASWVSRRLALVRELPEEIQEHVRRGGIQAHAAMKYLVPLARANREACVQLAQAIAPKSLSTREVGRLYAAYVSGSERTRALIVCDPALVLRSQEAAQKPAAKERGPTEQMLCDLGALGAIARRALRRLREDGLTALVTERDELARCLRQARADTHDLFSRLSKEVEHARPEHAHGDSASG